MKKMKRIIIISAISIILIGGLIFGFYKLFKDKNSLTIAEKTWISNNKNSVYTINVPNDINVFGKNGAGVFFDFINSLDEELSLKLNSSVYSVNSTNDSLGFNVDTSYNSRDLLIYMDYFVLISKDKNSVVNLEKIADKTIGINGKDLSYVSSYYSLSNTIKSYDSGDALFKGLEDNEVSYVIVPLNQYKDTIVSKSYNVSYFFNDAKVYYYLHLGNDKTLNSIITKYYKVWMNNEYNKSYNRNNYNLFINSLKITDIQEDELTDKSYIFEYLVNQPYQLISRGDFTGVVSEYLNSFTEFSDIEFEYSKVKKFNNLKSNISKKKIDLYFNQYNYSSAYSNININFNIDYYLISNREVKLNIDSLKSYNGEIYVEENSMLYEYLSNYKNITTKTYSKLSKVKSLIKKDNIVLVDKLSYDNYLVDNLSNVHILLEDTVDNKTYTFNYKNGEDIFFKLFSSYVNTLNPKEVVDDSLNTYFETYEAGSRTVKLARYIIMLIIILVVGTYLLI